MTNLNNFIKAAKQTGYTNISKPIISDIVFEPEFRAMCDMNTCGKFNTTWVCPPACGSFETLNKKVTGYKQAVLLQKVYTLTDSFDFEGMMAGQADFDTLFDAMMQYADKAFGNQYYSLKAGSCHLCDTCTYPDTPCIYPNKARPSIEACGINVTALCTSSGVPYMNGKNTVSYVALFLFL